MSEYTPDNKHKVIMPTSDQLAEFETDGRARQKRRGRIEIIIGTVLLGIGILIVGPFYDTFEPMIKGSALKSRPLMVIFLFGIIELGVGISRILKP